MLTVEADGSEEARTTKKNEVQKETKDNMKSRVHETGVYEGDEKGTRAFEEDGVRDGMHVNRSW